MRFLANENFPLDAVQALRRSRGELALKNEHRAPQHHR